MSNLVFPTLVGMKIGVTRRQIAKTDIQEAFSGAEFRTSRADLRWRWKISFDGLIDDGAATGDLQKLCGLWQASKGAFDSFLFSPPDQTNTALLAPQMTGDSITRTFLLQRPYGAGVEWIRELDTALLALTVRVNGTITAVTTSTQDGIILCTFATAPADAAAVTASFGFRYRVRFLDDALEVTRFAQSMFRQGGVELLQVLS